VKRNICCCPISLKAFSKNVRGDDFPALALYVENCLFSCLSFASGTYFFANPTCNDAHRYDEALTDYRLLPAV
jgi:hypothetical protein